MTAKKIDLLNIGLMVISLIAAFILPFWLFIFSYAVLGPLHYLTEIGWLKKKQFFTTGKYDFVPLAIIAVVWTAFFIIIEEFDSFPESLKVRWFGEEWWDGRKNFQTKMNDILFAGLIGSIVMVFVKKWWAKVLALAGGFAIGVALSAANFANYTYIIGALLPTLIHVYIFTGIFMLYGAMKSRSTYGYIGVVALLTCAVGCFLVPGPESFAGSNYAVEVYKESEFHHVNALLLNFGNEPPWDVADATIFKGVGIQVQRFMAFAYTYHYLNWFSKTSIIGWHKIPKVNLISALLIWVASVVIYFIDYRLGLKTLLFLSILHVVLEFPLNVHSFTGVFKGIFSGGRGGGEAKVLDG